jgi:hypothetical protein
MEAESRTHSKRATYHMRSRSSYLLITATLLISVRLTPAVATATAAPDLAPNLGSPIGHPAVWRQHDMIVDLQDLTHGYSCDDLWYKFHDILLALGARPDTKILAYNCSGPSGAKTSAPSVHLHFAMPELVTGTLIRWADIHAAPETVRLTPGQPASLRESDCALVRDIKDQLLGELGDTVVKFKLACNAPQSLRRPFSVTVQALTAVNSNPRVVAHLH